MAKFNAIDELLDRPLRLPYGGRIYEIAPPSARAGLIVEELMGVAAKAAADETLTRDDFDQLEALSDDDELNLYRLLLGDTWDELDTDGVHWEARKHMALTVLAWVHRDEDAAAEVWASRDPKAKRPPQDHKTKRK